MGADAKLDRIGRAAEKTHGMVNITKPLELVREVRSIYQNPVIATGVKVRCVIHPAFAFNVSEKSESKKAGFMALFGKKKNDSSNASGPNVWEREIGNANSEMDLALSFEKNPEFKGDVSKLKQVPFQLQVFFVSQKTGAKCVRVVTESRKVTKDREESEKSLVSSVVALRAVQESATVVRDTNNAEEALNVLHAALSLLQKASKSDEQQEEAYIMKTEAKTFETALNRAKNDKKQLDSDDFAATVLKSRNASLRSFQSGAKKNVKNRIVAVDQQERVGRFGIEATY